VTFTGTVQKVMWMIPHLHAHQVKQPMGRVFVYHVEAGHEFAVPQGWRKDTLKVGAMVTVSGCAPRTRFTQLGQATITAADGKKLFRRRRPAKAADSLPG